MADLKIGEVIRVARHRRNLSQRQLAERMKCPRSYVSKIERGFSVPQLDKLCGFGEALAIDGWKLLRLAQRRERARRTAGGLS